MIDLFRTCYRNLFRKKMRSFLTVLSIAIGVASVVLVGSIGQIGKVSIEKELDSIGIGSLSISVDSNVNPQAVLSQDDLGVVMEVQGVESVVPIVMEYTQTSMCGLVGSTAVWGVDSGARQIFSLELLHGRLLTADDVRAARRVCVVDEAMAETYYKRTNIVGKTVDITMSYGVETFEIVGVVSSGGNIMQNYISGYVPCFLYAPYTTVQQLTGNPGYSQLAVQVAPHMDVDTVGDSIAYRLAKTTGYSQEVYKAQNLDQEKGRLNNVLEIVTMVLSAVAAVSLVVAGLGIMTVMLVAVNERTREIGIKKAIGANRIEILKEFLLESLVISIVGIVLGMAIGGTIVVIGCLLVGIAPLLHLKLMLIAAVTTTAIGLIFGAYPAYVASKMSPVDALRFE